MTRPTWNPPTRASRSLLGAPRAIATALMALVLACMIPATGSAQNAFETMIAPNAGDAAYLGVALPIDLGLLFISPAPAERESHPFVLDVAARDALDWRNTRAAARTSDWLLRGFMLGAVAAPPLGNLDMSLGTQNGSLVGLEALATTQLVTGLVKHVVRRERPDGVAAHGEEAFASFFSGHSSTAFASATLISIYAHEYGWGGNNDWAIPLTAYTLAGFTGYLRVAGRRHWLTDVLTGALVGTGTAYITYRLRTGW